MTSTIVRLILAMLILPATGAVFLLGFVAVVPRAGPPSLLSLLFLWLIVYLFDAVYWLLLWHRMIRWTRRRIAHTAAVTLLAILCGCGMVAILSAIARGVPIQICVLIGGGVAPIAWVLGTVIAWRETPTERAERLAAIGATVLCPLCGYNMAGLKTADCPECGGSFTLDQLAASQPRGTDKGSSLSVR